MVDGLDQSIRVALSSIGGCRHWLVAHGRVGAALWFVAEGDLTKWASLSKATHLLLLVMHRHVLVATMVDILLLRHASVLLIHGIVLVAHHVALWVQLHHGGATSHLVKGVVGGGHGS